MSLFRKFLSLFRRGESPALYSPSQRAIYTYFDGVSLVRADPLVLYKRMMDVGLELSVDMKVSVSASKDAKRHHDEMIRKLRNIFNVPPLDAKGGLTEGEVVQLLDHFLLYCEGVKKNSPTSATTPTVTAASTSTSGGSPPTPNISDSGSTASEFSTGTPESSPTGPPSPLASSTPTSTTSER